MGATIFLFVRVWDSAQKEREAGIPTTDAEIVAVNGFMQLFPVKSLMDGCVTTSRSWIAQKERADAISAEM